MTSLCTQRKQQRLDSAFPWGRICHKCGWLWQRELQGASGTASWEVRHNSSALLECTCPLGELFHIAERRLDRLQVVTRVSFLGSR